MAAPYDIYPAVDSDYAFPPEIRSRLAQAAEFKALFDPKAPLASPIFTGTPQAPAAPLGDASTQLANTDWVSRNGTVRFATLAAMHAAYGNVPENTIASVGRYTVTGSLVHISSMWMKNGGNWLPVPNVSIMIGGDSKLTDQLTFGNALLSSTNGTTIAYNPGTLITSINGYGTYRWNGSGWYCFEGEGTSGIGFAGTVVNYDSGDFVTSVVRNRFTTTLTYSLNIGGNGLSQGGTILSTPEGFRGAGTQRQWGVGMYGYGNSQGYVHVYMSNNVLFYYQSGAYGGGPQGSLPGNMPIFGTLTYRSSFTN